MYGEELSNIINTQHILILFDRSAQTATIAGQMNVTSHKKCYLKVTAFFIV